MRVTEKIILVLSLIKNTVEVGVEQPIKESKYLCTYEDNPLQFTCWTDKTCDELTYTSQMDSRNASEYLNCFTICDESDYSCKEGKRCDFIKEQFCSEEIKCDYIPCDMNCGENFYKCKEEGKCASRDTLCNGKRCDGCAEDHGWENGHGFKCLRKEKKCVLPQQLLCDDISDCDGGADRCFAIRSNGGEHKNLLRDKCHECLDGSMIISRSSVCDGIIDCPDLSDECLCWNKPTICEKVIEEKQEGVGKTAGNVYMEMAAFIECDVIGNLRCNDGRCIRKNAICDGTPDCDIDESYDLCDGTIFCRNATKQEKCRCSDECLNEYGTACDGVINCPRIRVTNPNVRFFDGFPEDECQAQCEHNRTVDCDESKISIISGAVGPRGIRGILCGYDKYENRSSYDNYIYSARSGIPCDGVIQCPNGDDEDDEQCPNYFKCDTDGINVFWITQTKVCDGVADCFNRKDESATLCNATRFFCDSGESTKLNYDPTVRCNYVITCDDYSDEIKCNDGRFYCEGGKPLFVKQNQKFDGRGDCEDWSDECPSVSQSESTDPFSSRYELIANPILQGFVWIMGFLSIFGNGVVIYRGIKKLREIKRNKTGVINQLLVVNLATSDFLMGVYLIGIGSVGIALSGNYCSQDQAWRTSPGCAALGVLTVLSSEASVITMVWMTFCRLYSIAKPFSSKLTKRIVLIMIVNSWVVSILIAALPLVPSLGAVFISRVTLKYNPYTKGNKISIEEARTLFKDMVKFDNQLKVDAPDKTAIDLMTWHDIDREAKKVFQHERIAIEQYFGYYSSAGVCIPSFFVTKSDPAWKYSFSVTLFNFVAFLFVFASYIAIYFKSREISKIRTDDTSSRALQRKVVRLIATDFCCWIPICIMAFSKLGGVPVPDIAYVIAAIILLPINSALNPILYSDLLDLLSQKIKSTFCSRAENNTEISLREITSTGK